ncbi:unannotated protein [freshwater metagenome]|uniref:Unannotated protein n=1 Tax=freshwater metagenome TaxID=449393 RepID=A0A6J7JSE0_9ZZZZ|nr:hypothetical protein [Actinomycetota bacterium]MSW30844.1 hypothetical protein [Actinomycetota bacterium]MSY15112.1 hypothetical protein [Actinomycetota bacterium]
MAVDLVIALSVLISGVIGYKNGFIRTIFKFVGYIAGGVLGIYFALKFSHDWALDLKRIGFVIIAIIGAGALGSFAGGALAKGLKATVVRGPLAFLDSMAGSALEIIRTVVVIYLIATVLLWSPWESAQNQVAKSQILAKVQPYMPHLITQANDWVKAEFLNLHL